MCLFLQVWATLGVVNPLRGRDGLHGVCRDTWLWVYSLGLGFKGYLAWTVASPMDNQLANQTKIRCIECFYLRLSSRGGRTGTV